ncbi:MAG: serine hydrolase [Chthoniobacteraceae bacterium]
MNVLARSIATAALAQCAALAGPPELDAALDAVAPGIQKWATVCIVTSQADGTPAFHWHDYAQSGSATDFWPASAIKIYAAVAALELLNERGFPLDATVSFEHRERDGAWVLDCARTVREMLSEVFRRSSNEDYTLLLRMVGIDRMNTQFLTPERGFPHSALMRGYVLGRPYGYVREESQRITLRAADGLATTFEHTWRGRFYAEERGCKIIDARTGNATSPRELAECLRRVLFAEHLAESDRYRLTPDQLEFLRHGGAGLTGLQTRAESSGPAAWKGALDAVFPQARFFHKCGVISNYALELAYVDDSAASGKRFILVPVIAAGEATKPAGGEALIGEMSRAIGEWVKSR